MLRLAQYCAAVRGIALFVLLLRAWQRRVQIVVICLTLFVDAVMFGANIHSPFRIHVLDSLDMRGAVAIFGQVSDVAAGEVVLISDCPKDIKRIVESSLSCITAAVTFETSFFLI